MVTEVDFIGRWIEAAPDEHLEQKVAEYALDGRNWSGRDNEMRIRLRVRCQNELSKRRLCDRKGRPTSS